MCVSLKKNKNLGAIFTLDNLFFATAQGTSNDLIATVMQYFGFSVSASSAIGTINSYLGIFNLLGSLLYVKSKHPLRFLRIFCTSWRIFLPFIYFAALLPIQYGAPVMAVAYLLSNLAFQFQNSPYLSWMTGTLEGKIQKNYYLWRSTIWLIVYTIATMIVNFFVDKAQIAGTMDTCLPFVGAFFTLLLIISIYYLFRLPAPENKKETTENHSIKEMFRIIFSNASCRKVLYLTAVTGFFSSFSGFFGLYRIQVLNVSLFEVSIWSTVGYVLRILISPLVAKLANRFGWVKVTSIGHAMTGIASLLWLLITENTLWLFFPIASVLTVMPHTITDAGNTNIDIMAVPAPQRSIYYSVKAMLSWIVTVISSTLLTAIVKVLETLQPELLRYIFLPGAIGAVVIIIQVFRLDLHLKKQAVSAIE